MAPLSSSTSIESSCSATATTGTDSESSRTVRTMFEFTVSEAFANTKRARAAPAALYVSTASISPQHTGTPVSCMRMARSGSGSITYAAVPASARRLTRPTAMGSSAQISTWFATSGGTDCTARIRPRLRCSSHGAYTSLMKRNGRMISSSTKPDSSTTVLNTRPRSLSNVMSPKPKVLMTVSAQ